jgi:hypothetical protein
MARQVKNREKWHSFTMRQRIGEGIGELTLVGKGKRAYLWAGRVEGGRCEFFSGAATLRKLARAILKELGPE